MEVFPVINQLAANQPIETSLAPDVHAKQQPEHANGILTDFEGEEFQAGSLAPYTQKQLNKAIEEANRLLVGKNTKLSYQIHEATGRTVVQLLDINTDEVVKEIPPIKLLDGLANLWDLAGILVDKKG